MRKFMAAELSPQRDGTDHNSCGICKVREAPAFGQALFQNFSKLQKHNVFVRK